MGFRELHENYEINFFNLEKHYENYEQNLVGN